MHGFWGTNYTSPSHTHTHTHTHTPSHTLIPHTLTHTLTPSHSHSHPHPPHTHTHTLTVQAVRDKAMSESVTRGEEIASLQRALQSHLATIADCQARNREDETHRRMLHNTIQELKGGYGNWLSFKPSDSSLEGAAKLTVGVTLCQWL